jgi:hypothetical protein
MIGNIPDEAKADPSFTRLFERVKECAQMYLIEKARQRGYLGMGDVATLEDELRIALDAMIEYGRGKGYIGDSGPYDLDSMAEEVLKADA